MGNVHTRQFCGQLTLVRCTWQMFPDLDSVLAEPRTFLTAYSVRCKGVRQSPLPVPRRRGLLQVHWPSVQRLATALAPIAAATCEARQPTSVTLDGLHAGHSC
jgi:hypothetical protein